MTRQDEDREGAKPYRTYKARRPRRTQVDDELAGARPARARPQPSPDGRGDSAGASDYPRQSDKAYRTYGPAPDGGRKSEKAKKNAGAAPRRRRRFRWWYIPVAVFALLVIAGVVVHGPGLARVPEVRPGRRTRPTSASTRRLAPSSPRTTAGSGATAPRSLLFGLDAAGLPGALGHDHAHALRPQDAHDQPALDPPRHAASTSTATGQTKINEAMWCGGPSLALKTVKELHRHHRQPRHGRRASRASRGSSTRSAASTSTCRRR